MKITRADGLLTVTDVAALCGVEEVTVRGWINRGYTLRDGSAKVRMAVAKKEGRANLVTLVEAAKAEFHTRVRARRAAGLNEAS